MNHFHKNKNAGENWVTKKERAMAVCYFNNNLNNKYNCSYEIDKDLILIEADYNIRDEIEVVNGVRSFGSDTEYSNRDILIVDYDRKKHYLVKNAWYCGDSMMARPLDFHSIARFKSNVIFSHSAAEPLTNIKDDDEISEIKIYSNSLQRFCGCQSLERIESETALAFSLARDKKEIKELIGKENIKEIAISDVWESNANYKNGTINISFRWYIKIVLEKAVKYTEVNEYVNELILYFQLLRPNTFDIDEIKVNINDEWYTLSIPINSVKIKTSYTENSVESGLFEYIGNCYSKIPYRNTSVLFRSIAYIVCNTSRNLEDNFLMFYRFIEGYYKSNGKRKQFILKSIQEHNMDNIETDTIKVMSNEIVTLRNHYVHEGYHIEDGKIYDKKTQCEINIDVEKLYEYTKLLYRVTIDIIFKNLLGYEKYSYKKHF